MNLDEIQKLIEEDGGKIIIVERGKPIMVITSFDEYNKKKVRPEKKAVDQTAEEPSDEELKIEDLPF